MTDDLALARVEGRNQTITSLLSYGLSPSTIASMLDITISEIKSLTTTTTHLTTEDRELSDAVRSLMWKATREATLTLEFGPPEAKQQLIRTLISNASKLVGKETSEDTETNKSAFEQLFAEMRDIPSAS